MILQIIIPLLFVQQKLIKPKIKASERRSMSIFSYKTLIKKHTEESENNLIIFQNNNMDQTFNGFCNFLRFLVDKYQLLVEIKQNKNRKQWVTNRLKTPFGKRNNGRTKCLRTKNDIDKNRYLQLKSKSTQIITTQKNFHTIQNSQL